MTLHPAPKRATRHRSPKHWFTIFCSVLLMGASSLLHAADPTPPVWQGVWQGTIGSFPVRACLAWDRIGPGDAFGSYYYLSRLRTIRLEQQGTSKIWIEGYAAPKGSPRRTGPFPM